MSNPPNINGYVNLHKPIGITSMEAVRRIKRHLPKKTKVGHAGTLDPLAEGVLPICIGSATRLMEYVVSGTKIYVTQIKLGYVTDTYDAEGTITAVAPNKTITLSDIEQTLPIFIGNIHQTPPMYSALKQDGKRLYDLARSGVEVTRPPRPVHISSIDILEYSYPLLTLSVTCGSGVYIRSLAFDIGNALECGAYVTSLIRARSGAFLISEATSLPDVQAQGETPIEYPIHPIDFALQNLPSSQFPDEQALKLIQGQTISLAYDLKSLESNDYRAYNSSLEFFGIIRLIDSVWHPLKIFPVQHTSP